MRIISVSSLAILAACSGGGGTSSSTGSISNSTPIVNAGSDQTVSEGDIVQLSGAASDADGDALTITWSQVSGTLVNIQDTSSLSTEFTAPNLAADEDLVLRLTVSDGVNASVSDELTITVQDSQASLDAGYGRIVTSGTQVTLNAQVSGGTLSWRQLAGTSVTLSDASSATPSFTAPNVAQSETLVFEAELDTGSGTALTDQVSVEIWVGADSTMDLTVLADFSDQAPWACDVDPVTAPDVTFSDIGGAILVDSNGIPAHATGTFPNFGNPNSISEQIISVSFDTNPALANSSTEMSEFGITLDGVLMERDTAESYQNAGQWRYEAITPGLAESLTNGAEFSYLGTDCNNAHVQPNGNYHYHGLMEGLINRLGETNQTPGDLILGGYAADGFPFYLRYGYADASDPTSGLTVIQSSWELKAGTRSSGPGGAYDGTFREDWEFVDGSGDLDECNGRFGPTPDYPNGIYHYYVTDDYPYIPRCVSGTPDASFRVLGARP